jgi:hypothetical protein
METHLLTCPSRKFLHIECPGCGLQRSLIALLKGEFLSSFRMYPATMLLIIMMLFTLAHLRFKFEWGAWIIKYLQISAAIVILVFYIYKILNHKIIA